MPRKKSYSHEEALSNATKVFWEQGYEHLGVRALGERTGVNRFALQTEFGGKQGLFLEVLDNYATDVEALLLKPLRAGGLAAIKAFFEKLTSQTPEGPRDFGCLMVNTVIENAGLDDPEIRAKTDSHYAGVLAALEQALHNARERGEIAADFEIKPAAEYLLASAMGIQVFVRNRGSVASATALGRIAIGVVTSWERGA